MKGDAYVLVTGLMIAALANLPEIQSQECIFYSDTMSPLDGTVEVTISETERKNKVILNLHTSNGDVSCSDTASTPFSKYIQYSHTANTNLDFTMKQEIGDDLDNGELNEEMLLIEQCELVCPQVNLTSILFIAVTIDPENTQMPKFSSDSGELTLEENFPKGLDFSYLLKVDNKSLSVSDKDLPFQLLTFDVSDPRFEALEPILRDESDNGHPRIRYEPRIAVKMQLDSAASPIKFNLIAKDTGNPPKESLFPITVNIVPQDVRDPEFEKPYYTSIIPNSAFKGTLKVEPKDILAYDGDKLINSGLRYKILENAGLDVKLKNEQPDKGVPIEIELSKEVEGSPTDKMRYIVIQAIQTDDEYRYETVVLAVELPQPVVTTTSTTMTTCPPCLTPTTSTTQSCTTQTTTEQTCTPCSPCTTASTPDVTTSCPTFDPTTHCPTGSPTGDPVSPFTTSSMSPNSSTTTTNNPNVSTTTKYTTTSITSTETGTPSSSSSCPTCPTESVTTCPTTECPTFSTECPTFPTERPTCPTFPTECPTCPTVTTVPCTTTTELPPDTVSTLCPITCPEPTTTSTLICDCPTTPVTVTCPTVPPAGNSKVQFEKQQYASEILENSPVNTFIVTLSATSTVFNEKPEYSFAEGHDAKYFVVDSKTGNVTTTQSLPVGNYLLDAIAQIPSGDKDHARIVVSAVMGTSCNGTQFSSPLYEFPVAERTTGIVGQVELRSTDNAAYTLSISSCSPPSMTDYFAVERNGSIVVIIPFNWTNNRTRIILTISAENQRHSNRMMSISTIVNIDVLDINEAPQFLDYGSSVVIGYPDRTYFDPSVQMPLFTVKANDADNEENATLTYHVMNEFDVFDIDLLTGSLFVKGLDQLNWETNRTVQIVARDKHGLEDTLSITVKPLSDNYITLMKAKSQSDSLTEETVANDMSRILGYQVVVLRIEKSPEFSLRVTQSTLIGYNYKVTLYALNKTTFITREEFTQKVNQANATGLSWTIDENLSVPQEYQVEKMIDTLSKETQSYTIATAVLGTLLGLLLILIVVYVVYVKKFKVERPWSKAFRAASLEVDKKHWDQRSFAQSSDQSDETSESQIDSYNRVLSGKSNEGTATPVIRFSMEKSIINENIQPTETTNIIEDEAYCPPTPLPKKSILKDPSVMDNKNSSKQRTNVENKLEDTAGVKFSPTPEVIQVAATAPEVEEVDLDNSNKDDDDDDDEFLIEEL